jgi:hypothetical protein
MPEVSNPKKQKKWKNILKKLDRLNFVTPPSAEEIKLRTQAEKICE